MDNVALTFHCVAREADTIAKALRAHTGQPVHVRQETVYGQDFSDAGVSEQVTGTLARAAVEIVVPVALADSLVALVASMRRSHPVRWMTTAVLARGRME